MSELGASLDREKSQFPGATDQMLIAELKARGYPGNHDQHDSFMALRLPIFPENGVYIQTNNPHFWMASASTWRGLGLCG
ncbi:hypothetical protein J6524_19640 [Bradyrhizobium sp. WSM 1738]|uniref:hypothetical protein n=1 Tax=Bradyrhizobium hereditatis TaxID=2821405 RepID=UPI001CE36294|nr:hypothetical protein [Bradyrhizobium hereditatis]MCA6117069.1 hypothetical protein [Bradyrhizobium hereditatis]